MQHASTPSRPLRLLTLCSALVLPRSCGYRGSLSAHSGGNPAGLAPVRSPQPQQTFNPYDPSLNVGADPTRWQPTGR